MAAPVLHAFDAIGTRWEIETAEPLPEDVRRAVAARIERFDATYSRFRVDSLVTTVARAERGGRFAFPTDAEPLFDLYDRLHAATGGAVDPLVGLDLELLGYDAAYSLTPVPDLATRQARDRPSWPVDVRRDGRDVVTRRPLVIDVGAAGKGYLVDLVVGHLRDEGIAGGVVDAGGDLRRWGTGSVRVGLEHPGRPGHLVGVADLAQGALCASASNRRAWGHGLHHVLDVRTGRPTSDVVATWVAAADALTADGVATALSVADPSALDGFAFEHVRLHADGRLEASDGFGGELFV